MEGEAASRGGDTCPSLGACVSVRLCDCVNGCWAICLVMAGPNCGQLLMFLDDLAKTQRPKKVAE